MYGHTYSKSMDHQPGKVANPARGQLDKENEYFPVPVRAWEFVLAGRVRQSRPTSACSSPYGLNLLYYCSNTYLLLYVCSMYGHTYSKAMDRPGKVANPARGQLNSENECFPVRVRA